MKYLILSISLILSAFTLYAGAPKVVAHRGHHRADGSAQNSIRSLVKADSIGADFCEFDVWLSADSVLYVNHNADINWIVIETSTSQEIDTCRLSNGEFIPRLEAFLDKAQSLDIGLILELKPHKDSTREDIAVPLIIEMIKQRGLGERTEFISFSRNACKLFTEQSECPVALLSSIPPDQLAELGVDGADFNIKTFREHPDWIKKLHDLDLSVNIWTVDSENDIHFCIDNGADYITTNEPELTRLLIYGP